MRVAFLNLWLQIIWSFLCFWTSSGNFCFRGPKPSGLFSVFEPQRAFFTPWCQKHLVFSVFLNPIRLLEQPSGKLLFTSFLRTTPRGVCVTIHLNSNSGKLHLSFSKNTLDSINVSVYYSISTLIRKYTQK